MCEQRERQPPKSAFTQAVADWLFGRRSQAGKQDSSVGLGFLPAEPGDWPAYLSVRQRPRRTVTGTRFGARLSQFKSASFCSLDLWAPSSISSFVKL